MEDHFSTETHGDLGIPYLKKAPNFILAGFV